MNCDAVFQVLTRGPFPTGSASLDVAVERHLAGCASCRRVATALQPAIEVFEEAVSPDESRGLPSYSGYLLGRRGDASRPATRTKRATRTTLQVLPMRRATRLAPPAWPALARFGLAVAAGLALSITLIQLGQGQPRGATRPASGVITLMAAKQAHMATPLPMQAYVLLDKMGLKPPCRPDIPRLAEGDGGAGFLMPAIQQHAATANCCVECHRPGSSTARVISRAGRHKIATACVACHEREPGE